MFIFPLYKRSFLLSLACTLSMSLNIRAQEGKPPAPPHFNLHFQATYVYQYKPEFDASYSGPNSLIADEERQNSMTATMYGGVRLWKGAEAYINPEVAGGSGLSGAFGLGASTNGETFRVGDPAPTLYLARGYFTQTFRVGKMDKTKDENWYYENVRDGANELAGRKPLNYLRFYIGKLSIGDLFDNNNFANSPRVQFMNWCLMNNGAWDYAANVRGYTYAFATVLKTGNMAYRAAIATLPTTANGAELNTDLGEAFGINAEVQRINPFGTQGNIRLLAYHNYGRMGDYRYAISHASGVPDVTTARRSGHSKTGIGLNMDQLIHRWGVFFRAGWNDGATETWVFTESDLSITPGAVYFLGKGPVRYNCIGAAAVVNGLSAAHRDYLAAGGNGFQLGDGKLSYANETAFEVFFRYKPVKEDIWLTADYQFLMNPGYNSDRGPVNVFSVRVHAEL